MYLSNKHIFNDLSSVYIKKGNEDFWGSVDMDIASGLTLWYW